MTLGWTSVLALAGGLAALEAGGHLLVRRRSPLPHRTSAPGHPAVLYDGQCVFCTAQMTKLARLVPPGTFDALSFHDDGVLARFPGVTHEACMRALVLILADGRVYAGAAAAARAVALRGGLARAALVYYVPGVRALCDVGYALVAANRYRIMGKKVARGECAGGTCALHARGTK